MGMRAKFAEPRVRALVAEHLGVDFDDLATDVSLTDNLAADSLDLLELAIALEDEFGIRLPEAIVDELRTYGDLVAAVRCQAEQGMHPQLKTVPEAQVYARVVPAWPRAGGDLQRAAWLTPYTVQTIAEDALHGGRGARLELTVAGELPEGGLADIRQRFAWLVARGIQVHVRRDSQARGPELPQSPHAA
jgi:acyl carrier protein